MLRIVLFLVLIALAAAGAAWVADQPGDFVLTAGGFRASMTLPTFVLLLGLFAASVVLVWSILTTIWRDHNTLRAGASDNRTH